MNGLQKSQHRASLSTNSDIMDQQNSRLAKSDQKWETLKDEIHLLYIVENKSLLATMDSIAEKCGFEASTRKWKMKLKEWGYEKHLSEQDMKIIVAKAERRIREEGKATVFLHNGMIMPDSRLETFKKRKSVRESEAASPSNPTPLTIAYFTPFSNPNTSFLYPISTTSNSPTKAVAAMPSNTRSSQKSCTIANVPKALTNDKSVEFQGGLDIEANVEYILKVRSADPAAAVSACHVAIDSFFEHSASSLIPVIRSLFKIGYFQMSKGLIKECIATYRGALAFSKQQEPLNPDIRMQIAEHSKTLGDILLFQGQASQEALRRYDYAATIFLENGRLYETSRCFLAAARFENKKEPVHSHVGLLQKALFLNICNILELHEFSSMEGAREAIRELQNYYNCYEKSQERKHLMFELSNIEHSLFDFARNNTTHYLILKNSVKLADALSKHGDIDIAGSLFDVCLKKSVKLEIDKFSKLEFLSQTLFAQTAHFERQEMWAGCRSSLTLLLEGIPSSIHTEAHQSLTELRRLLGRDTNLPTWTKHRAYLNWFVDPKENTREAVYHFTMILSRYSADGADVFSSDITMEDI